MRSRDVSSDRVVEVRASKTRAWDHVNGDGPRSSIGRPAPAAPLTDREMGRALGPMPRYPRGTASLQAAVGPASGPARWAGQRVAATDAGMMSSPSGVYR